MTKSILKKLIVTVWLAASSCLATACRTTGPPASSSGTPPVPTTSLPSEEQVYQNTIKWSTASEVDNFGFDVYRGSTAEGPFERLNEDPIAGGGTTDEPRYYEYVDDTIDPRETYYYYVESISMSGVREKFTPIGKARPKIQSTGDDPSP